ncbi:hypothetical protein CHARACLAT_033695 [Characodon lateralis]|uniref:Uncharacterized protein n=1 Tax=Characodon lateralis TaxID=208331 RepID=A0ABU7DLY5_9TELE|nr:hypothetical protein [Characodon lateralis]
MLLSLAQLSFHSPVNADLFTHLFRQYFYPFLLRCQIISLPCRSVHDQLSVYDPVSVATSMILAKHLLDQAFHVCSFACLFAPLRLASSLLVDLFSASSVYEPILKTIAVENITNWGKTVPAFSRSFLGFL